MEQDMIHISKENYTSYRFLTPLAFSIAEGGAMGSPGQVIVVDGDKTVYEFSLFDLEGHMADSVLPNMDKAFYASSAELLALGLHHVDLGVGNHLFVNSSIYEQFHPIAQKYKRDLGLLYQKWINLIIEGHDVEVPQKNV